jgi:hypothetical protein
MAWCLVKAQGELYIIYLDSVSNSLDGESLPTKDNEYTFMLRMGFEPTNSLFEPPKCGAAAASACLPACVPLSQ